jgi:protein TonB
MRRHRQKNTLLPKMIGVAVLINAILLPVLSQLGMFHKGGFQRLTQVSLVKLPPPEKSPEERKHSKPAPPKAKAHRAEQKRAASSHPLPPDPNKPKVVAAASGNSDGGDDQTIENNGTGNVGEVTPPPARHDDTPVKPDHTDEPKQIQVPDHPEMVPQKSPPPPPPPRNPVIVAAQPIDQPRPEIPDELRNDDRDTTFMALFDIKASGAVTVSTLKGTGNQTLDRLAMETARKWKFRPATRDGEPVDSYLRLQIEFRVSD